MSLPVDNTANRLPRAYGLVVGINHYNFANDSLDDLTTPEYDARRFYKWAISPYGGGTKETVHLLHRGTRLIRKPYPIHQQIEDKLAEIIMSAANDRRADKFYFYFSGHGCIHGEGGEALVLPDWRKTIPGRSLEVLSYLQCLQKAPFRDQFFFIDACRNFEDIMPGYSARIACDCWRTVFDGDVSEDPAMRYQVVFYAAGRSQKAAQEKDGKLSYFTEALLKGLNGDRRALTAVNGKPAITADSLLRFVREVVGSWASEKDRTQDPAFMPGFDKGEAIIVHFPEASLPPLDVFVDPGDNPPPRLHVIVQQTTSPEAIVDKVVIDGGCGKVSVADHGVFRILAYESPNEGHPWGHAVFDADYAHKRRVRINKLHQGATP